MHISFLTFFFFNDTATTEIYTLSLHDALPICPCARPPPPTSRKRSGSSLRDAGRLKPHRGCVLRAHATVQAEGGAGWPSRARARRRKAGSSSCRARCAKRSGPRRSAFPTSSSTRSRSTSARPSKRPSRAAPRTGAARCGRRTSSRRRSGRVARLGARSSRDALWRSPCRPGAGGPAQARRARRAGRLLARAALRRARPRRCAGAARPPRPWALRAAARFPAADASYAPRAVRRRTARAGAGRTLPRRMARRAPGAPPRRIGKRTRPGEPGRSGAARRAVGGLPRAARPGRRARVPRARLPPGADRATALPRGDRPRPVRANHPRLPRRGRRRGLPSRGRARLAAHAGADRLGRARPPAARRDLALLPRPPAAGRARDAPARRSPAASRGARRAGARHRPAAAQSLTGTLRTGGGRRPTLLPCRRSGEAARVAWLPGLLGDETLRHRLPNGLTVLVEENHAAPVAALQVWVRVGSADELPGEAGLAHLHEHMLFKGTARRGPGEIASSIEGCGGEINAWTSFDQTVYHVVVASQFLAQGMDVLADAITSAAFDPEELRREIEVVCEEIKRSLDSPTRKLSKELFATAFTRHPYGRPVIGSEESVRSFTREGILRFYRRWYQPENCVLVRW